MILACTTDLFLTFYKIFLTFYEKKLKSTHLKYVFTNVYKDP